jgi:type III secretion protein T
MVHLDSPLDAVQLYLTALAISMPRPLALFSILPVMTRLGLPQLLQSALIIVISFPVAAPLFFEIQPLQPLSPVFTVVLCLKEAVLGLLIGMVMAIPFWAMEMAGDIVDLIRQAPEVELQDPRNTTQATPTGTLFSIFSSLYFISVGGFIIIINTIYKSYEVWPALKEWPSIDENAVGRILELFDSLFKASFLIAAPILIFILVAYFILIIISRFAPQTNVFSLSLSFKNIGFLVAIQIYGSYIISYFVLNSSYLKETLEVMKGFFE